MCGICGFTGKPENREQVIRKMTEVITHRGPDSEGYFSDDAVCMGFRRLSIIDLESGNQPIFNEDKSLVLTFNGEIYNYRELRKELEGLNHSFATDSDSEVLVHAFEQWQEDMLPRLRGMFAFAIYNRNDGSIFIARDFFGIKPMHYTMIGNDFVYASEIKSILEHPNFEKRFNNRALDSYLSFQYALPPETFFEEVYCLLPGHYLWYKDGSYDTTRYFEPKFYPKDNMSEEEAVDLIEKVFENSVNAHKIADVEVGCFLSSGVDSSYVSTYFADQKTFTVGFDFGEKYNEISWAETLCKIIDVEHHTHLISSAEFWDAVPTVQYYMDQPLADPSCVALYFVSRLASQYVKVVLSGEGADELFGGYTCYNDPRVFKNYQKFVPHFLRKALRAVARKLPDIKGRDFVIRACDKLEDRYIGNAFMYDLREKQQILKNPSIATAPQRSTRRHYYRCRRYDDVTKMQYLDINLWMTGDILLKADRMSMANSLELRVPFLDKEVFKVAASLPTSLRVNKSNTKYAMRKAAARHLPEATAEKEKLGFPVPTRVWLRDEKYYNVVKERFLGDTAEKFFNTDALLKWLDEHFSGKEDNSRRIWTVYVFLVWYDIYFNENDPHPEKPENHLDELKALAEEERRKKLEAPGEVIMAAAQAAQTDGGTEGETELEAGVTEQAAEPDAEKPEEPETPEEAEATEEAPEDAPDEATEETAAEEAEKETPTDESPEDTGSEDAPEDEIFKILTEAPAANGEADEAPAEAGTDGGEVTAEALLTAIESADAFPEDLPGDDATADDFLEGMPEEGESLEQIGEEQIEEAAEEAVEEAPAEEVPAEEAPVEEAPAEEAPAEEVPAEEAPAEEAPEEETPTEEINEETTEDSVPFEEAAEEAPAAEEPVNEENEEDDEEDDGDDGDIPFAEEVVEDETPIEESMWVDTEAYPIDEGSMPALIENDDPEPEPEKEVEEFINISNPDDKEIYREPRNAANPQEQMQMALDSIERRAKYLDEPNVISDEAISDIVSQIRFYNEEESE